MSGYRSWTPGEIITANNVQSYLQDQTVMVFADSTARGSAIPVPTEGMLSWLEDENQYSYYDGAQWENLIVPITGGTSGEPYISNGTAEASFQDLNAKFITLTLTQKSSDYTVQASDANTVLDVTAAGTITVPDVFTTVGDRVDVLANTTGTVTIAAGTGVTSWAGVGTAGTAVEYYIDTPYAAASVIKTAANEYRVVGRVSA